MDEWTPTPSISVYININGTTQTYTKYIQSIFQHISIPKERCNWLYSGTWKRRIFHLSLCEIKMYCAKISTEYAYTEQETHNNIFQSILFLASDRRLLSHLREMITTKDRNYMSWRCLLCIVHRVSSSVAKQPILKWVIKWMCYALLSSACSPKELCW